MEFSFIEMLALISIVLFGIVASVSEDKIGWICGAMWAFNYIIKGG